MSKLFTYSLLQFTPFEGSGELLNIGLLIAFPDHRKIQFVYPKNLARLQHAFSQVPEAPLKGILQGITRYTETCGANPVWWSEAEFFGENRFSWTSYFLIPDASSIRFSPVRSGICYAEPEQIIADYTGRYLAAYRPASTVGSGDFSVAREYKRQLKALNFKQTAGFEENVSLEIAGHTYQFDFSWKNGRKNLVKALSFDLKQADAIQRKSERYFGQITLLQPEASSQALHFDLLIAKPRDKQLFRSFDRALDILGKLPATQIWDETQVKAYAEHTAKSIESVTL